MRRFYKNIAVLLLLFFIIDKPIGFLISKGVQLKQFDQRIALICEKKIDPEILILGSSRALNDLDAAEIEKATNSACYNLGYSGSNLDFHLSVLRIALESELSPTKVLLTVDHSQSFKANNQGIFRNDKLLPYSSYNQVYREICDHTNQIYWLGRGFWMYRENDNFFNALNYLKNGQDLPDITSNIDDHGSVILTGRSPKFNVIGEDVGMEPYSKDGEADHLIKSLEEIIEICLARDIQLSLVFPPVLKFRAVGFRERIDELVKRRAEILDFSSLNLEEEYFYDNGHLNKKGATALAVELARKL
ncbi:MAG: hypothetical protein RIE58_01815 [Vicingaceae bacterium]